MYEKSSACIVPTIAILPEEEGTGGKHRVFITVFLMRSETVSMINLQTAKSILKINKNAQFFFLIQNFLGRGHGSVPTTLCPLNSPPLDNTSGSTTDLPYLFTAIRRHLRYCLSNVHNSPSFSIPTYSGRAILVHYSVLHFPPSEVFLVHHFPVHFYSHGGDFETLNIDAAISK